MLIDKPSALAPREAAFPEGASTLFPASIGDFPTSNGAAEECAAPSPAEGLLRLPAEGDLLDGGNLALGETAPLPVAAKANGSHHALPPGDDGESLLASMLDRQLNFSASAPGRFFISPSSQPGSSGGSLGGLLTSALQADSPGSGLRMGGLPGPADEDMFGSLDLGSDFAGDLTAAGQFMNNFSFPGMLPLGLQPPAAGPHAFPGAAGNDAAAAAGMAGGEHPFGEHPSRTLFVRNINWSVEEAELRSLFEAYGEIRAIYTACKHRGFVMVSYFDLRSAKIAMKALQGRVVRRRRLDIHYSIPKDNPNDRDVNQGTLVVFNLDPCVSTEELNRIFSQYGEVKEIRETPKKKNHKFVEYFDVRAAAMAMQYLNHAEICGKRIKLEPSRPGGARRNTALQQQQQQQRIQAEDEKRSLLHTANQPWNIPAGLAPPRPGQPRRGSVPGPDLLSPYSAPTMPHLLHAAGSPFDQAAALSTSGGALLPGTLQAQQQQAMPPASAGLLSSLASSLQQSQPQEGAVVSGLSASLQNANATAATTAANGGDGLQRNADVAALAAAAAARQRQQLGALQAAGWPYDTLQAQAALAELHSLHAQGLDAAQQQQQQQPQAGIPINITRSSSQHPASSSGSHQGAFSGLGGSSSASQDSGTLWGPQDPAVSQAGNKFSVSPVGSPWNGGNSSFVAAKGHGLASSSSGGDFSSGSLASIQSALGNVLAGSEPSLQDLQAISIHKQQLQGLARSASAADALSLSGLGPLASLPADGSLTGSASLGNLLHQVPHSPSGFNTEFADSLISAHQYGSTGNLSHSLGGQGSLDRFERQAANSARSSRRGSGADPVAEANRKAQQERMFSLDLVRVANGEDPRTTLMIKNIPNKYTQKMLLATIDEQFARTYDFFYLPIDFKNKCNMGYAFINMVAPHYILPLVERFNNRKWDKFNSEKVACISYARIQGKTALVTHFQNSSLMHEDKHCRPIIFASDGMTAGIQEAFPVGPSTRGRVPRTSANSGLPPQPQPIPVRFGGNGAGRGAWAAGLPVSARPQMGSMTNLAEAGAVPLDSPVEVNLSTSY